MKGAEKGHSPGQYSFFPREEPYDVTTHLAGTLRTRAFHPAHGGREKLSSE